MPRRCVFCGRSDLSNEHVVGQRFRKYLIGGSKPVSHWRGNDGGMLNQWEAPLLEVPVRRVCRQHCNNGWMREADEALEPLIGPMIQGRPTELTREDQERLSTWATRVAMLSRFRRDPPSPPLPERLKWLYERQEPPPDTHVWLGAYVDSDQAGYHSGLLSGFREDGMQVDGELSSLVIGHLVLQVWEHPDWGEINLTVPPEIQGFDVLIWPPSPLVRVWPPQRFIGPQDWPDFATRLGEERGNAQQI